MKQEKQQQKQESKQVKEEEKKTVNTEKIDTETEKTSTQENEKSEKTEQTEEKTQTKENKTEEIDWEKKYNSANDSYIRLMADFDNYRKHMIKDKADLIKNAGENIIKDFLPIIDNFERALKSMETAEDVAAVREGVVLIYNQIMNMLKNNGVTVIETENMPFNTDFHEAITTIPSPTPEMKDKIIDCTTKGYTMNEKVIRHAKVVVGA